MSVSLLLILYIIFLNGEISAVKDVLIKPKWLRIILPAVIAVSTTCSLTSCFVVAAETSKTTISAAEENNSVAPKAPTREERFAQQIRQFQATQNQNLANQKILDNIQKTSKGVVDEVKSLQDMIK